MCLKAHHFFRICSIQLQFEAMDRFCHNTPHLVSRGGSGDGSGQSRAVEPSESLEGPEGRRANVANGSPTVLQQQKTRENELPPEMSMSTASISSFRFESDQKPHGTNGLQILQGPWLSPVPPQSAWACVRVRGTVVPNCWHFGEKDVGNTLTKLRQKVSLMTFEISFPSPNASFLREFLCYWSRIIPIWAKLNQETSTPTSVDQSAEWKAHGDPTFQQRLDYSILAPAGHSAPHQHQPPAELTPSYNPPGRRQACHDQGLLRGSVVANVTRSQAFYKSYINMSTRLHNHTQSQKKTA